MIPDPIVEQIYDLQCHYYTIMMSQNVSYEIYQITMEFFRYSV